MYESRTTRPISRAQFVRRVAMHFLVALLALLLSIAIGMAGYLHFEPTLAWRDAFLNTTMLLGGMGPVDPPKTGDGKIFAGFFALYAGLIFILMASFILAPVAHRIMHTLHWGDD